MYYGVGVAAIIAIVCAAAYQDPLEIAAPWVIAKSPPEIGPVAERPANPNMKGDPNVTPATTIGVQINADKNPILLYNIKQVLNMLYISILIKLSI